MTLYTSPKNQIITIDIDLDIDIYCSAYNKYNMCKTVGDGGEEKLPVKIYF